MNDSGITISIVLFVSLSVWAGIFFYLWRIDSLARELRRKLEQHQSTDVNDPSPTPKATLERRTPSEQQTTRNDIKKG